MSGGIAGVGGLVGTNYNTISASYSTGVVSGSYEVGGLGYNSGSVSNSYSTGSVSGNSQLGGLVGYNRGTVSNSHYDLDSTTLTVAGEVLHTVTYGGLYGAQFNDWLTHGLSLNIADYLSRDANEYYTLGSLQNLKDMLGFIDVAGIKFRLTADLDLAPLPGWHLPVFYAMEFNGDDHTLANLNIAQPSGNNTGFIDALPGGSTVQNLGLLNLNVSGGNSVGGLVGYNAGTVSNAYVSGSVSGSSYVGGLVGSNYGTLNNSYSTGLVSGSGWAIGGLAGANYGAVNNSYWDTETSGQVGSSGGSGLNSAQMRQLASFAGWDISANGGENTVWRIYEGQTAPLLRSFLTPLTLTAGDTKTYDGQTYTGGAYAVSASTDPGHILGAANFGGAAQGAINAGDHVLTLSGLYSDQQRYDLIVNNGVLTIGQAPLTVTARDAGKTYDGHAYSGGNGLSYAGFVNDETSAVLGGALSYGGNSQGAVNAGEYAITPGGLSSGNYRFEYRDGVLAIQAAVANGQPDGGSLERTVHAPTLSPPVLSGPSVSLVQSTQFEGLLKVANDFIRLPE